MLHITIFYRIYGKCESKNKRNRNLFSLKKIGIWNFFTKLCFSRIPVTKKVILNKYRGTGLRKQLLYE